MLATDKDIICGRTLLAVYFVNSFLCCCQIIKSFLFLELAKLVGRGGGSGALYVPLKIDSSSSSPGCCSLVKFEN